jgi:hypothetical protein
MGERRRPRLPFTPRWVCWKERLADGTEVKRRELFASKKEAVYYATNNLRHYVNCGVAYSVVIKVASDKREAQALLAAANRLT